MSKEICVLDYETRSEADLKKTGAWEYSLHPSTRIMCVAWRSGTKETIGAARTKVWSPAFSHSVPTELLEQLLNPSVTLEAHNALFEQVITRHVLDRLYPKYKVARETPIRRWDCTAARAAARGLPRKLEGACGALGLEKQKDMVGHRIMLKLCKPRKPTKNNPSKWHSKKEDLLRVMEYCVQDVDAELELSLRIPELSPFEREVWELDQKINQEGFLCDRPLIKKILEMLEREAELLKDETVEITKGGLYSALQRNGVLKWLEDEGTLMPDLKKNTVKAALESAELSNDARRLLEIRQLISKTSTRKYEAFINRSNFDGRVRDILMYNAAVPTARWGGAGVQPQNFPRGDKSINTEEAIEHLKKYDYETLKMMYGDIFILAASCLRGMIIATPGKKFNCGDYAQIEVRVLFWLANHARGVEAFKDNRPIYEEQAQGIYNINYIENVKLEQRQVGKHAVLGCGFGMGPPKFKKTCLDQGQIEIPIDLAKKAVYSYREMHRPVVKLWENLERAAMAAVRNPGKRFTINKTTWFVRDKWLFCQLPSGRLMPYYGPSIKNIKKPWGEYGPALCYWGIHPLTKKWQEESTYGGKITENCVQAIARDLMAYAMLELHKKGFEDRLTVHDEILTEVPKDVDRLCEFEQIMCKLPKWAEGLPVKAEAWEGERYKK